MEETTEYRPELELNEAGVPTALSLATGIYKVLDRRNASDLKLLHVGEDNSLTDYLVICNATSSTHLRALADEVEYRLGLCDVNVNNRDGKGDGNSWIVLDFITVMVHVFTPDARKLYNLERLYPDAEAVEVVIEENND